jgi:hypothetical protein
MPQSTRPRTCFCSCHHFQTRGCQRPFLRLSYFPLEWQFRVSHFGLFLRFGIVLWFHSTTFGSVMAISWSLALQSYTELSSLLVHISMLPSVSVWLNMSSAVAMMMYNLVFSAIAALQIDIFTTIAESSSKLVYRTIRARELSSWKIIKMYSQVANKRY